MATGRSGSRAKGLTPFSVATPEGLRISGRNRNPNESANLLLGHGKPPSHGAVAANPSDFRTQCFQ